MLRLKDGKVFIIIVADWSLVYDVLDLCISVKPLLHEWRIPVRCGIHNSILFVIATLYPFCHVNCISHLLIFIIIVIYVGKLVGVFFLIWNNRVSSVNIRFLNLFEVLFCDRIKILKEFTVSNIKTIISPAPCILCFTLWRKCKFKSIHCGLVHNHMTWHWTWTCSSSYSCYTFVGWGVWNLLTVTSKVDGCLLQWVFANLTQIASAIIAPFFLGDSFEYEILASFPFILLQQEVVGRSDRIVLVVPYVLLWHVDIAQSKLTIFYHIFYITDDGNMINSHNDSLHLNRAYLLIPIMSSYLMQFKSRIRVCIENLFN